MDLEYKVLEIQRAAAEQRAEFVRLVKLHPELCHTLKMVLMQETEKVNNGPSL